MADTHQGESIGSVDIRLQLGLRIRRLREDRGWSQDVFAQMTQLGRSYPHKIESGIVDIQLTTLVKIAKAFKITPSQLLDSVGSESH
ncbi:helix-turn-helix domain-containing protein [Deinococcus aquiradiocola]|uniref:helix-turn-helix domain-containing protein n=1 Tax=Deinococcus aquiradiocola TaxID=393059 RepID=UPI001663CC86